MKIRNKYFLAFKTRPAELKAVENLNPEVLTSIWPIIEITKGRSPKSLNKSLASLGNLFGNFPVTLDVTSEPRLSNPELDSLFNPYQGYANWMTFLSSLKKEGFKNIYPTALFNFEDSSFEKNIIEQIKSLANLFKGVTYRLRIKDDGYKEDLNFFKVLPSDTELLVLLDAENIIHSSGPLLIEKTSRILNYLIPNLPDDSTIVFIGSSFPKSISDFGDDEHDTFKLEEVEVFNELKEKYEINYGDYGSICPLYRPQAGGNGWVPRIDVPLQDSVFYERTRRALPSISYANAYEINAMKLIQDPRFPEITERNWGLEQIRLAAENYAPGASPSFWISVRMNIHIHTQLKRLRFV